MLERRGFGLLPNHFEESQLLRKLPHYLPDDWKGAFALLVMVFVLSSFLDNIAAALIGGAMAHTALNSIPAAMSDTAAAPRSTMHGSSPDPPPGSEPGTPRR